MEFVRELGPTLGLANGPEVLLLWERAFLKTKLPFTLTMVHCNTAALLLQEAAEEKFLGYFLSNLERSGV